MKARKRDGGMKKEGRGGEGERNLQPIFSLFGPVFQIPPDGSISPATPPDGVSLVWIWGGEKGKGIDSF